MNLTRIEDIEAQLLQHQAQLNQIPSRWPQAPVAPRVLIARIIGGNTLTSGSQGIKYKPFPGTLTDTNSAIDPHANPALQDGLGYGFLYRNGLAEMEDDGVGGLRQVRVIIANRWSSSLISQALVVGTWIYLGQQITLNGTAGQLAYGVGL